MSRYIDAEKLVAWCMETYQAQSTVLGKVYVNALLTAVDSCRTADVVEVKHGYWVEENKLPNSSKFICSACGELAYYVQPNRDRTWKKCCPYKICPNCGAKMKGANDGT